METGVPEKYEWYTIATGAEYLGVTARQMRRIAEKRLIETTRLGGQRLLFSREALDAYVASCTTPARGA